MKSLLAITMLAAGFAALAISSANATSISFGSPVGELGTSQAYGQITAYGFTASTTGPNAGNLIAARLFGKADSGDETGLGLYRTDDNEINAPAGSQAVVLDIGAFVGQDLKLGFGSVQRGEGWRVGFSNNDTLPTNESSFGGYVNGSTDYPAMHDFGVRNSRYLIVEATSENILLSSFGATAVPEPASMALLGAGLVGVGYARRRAKRA